MRHVRFLAQQFQNNLIKTNFPLLVELSEFHRTVLRQNRITMHQAPHVSSMSFSGFHWNAGKGCTFFPDLQFFNIAQKGEGSKFIYSLTL